MEKFIVTVFPHEEEQNTDIDVEVALTQENFDLIEQANPAMTLAEFTTYLADNEVRNTVFTRASRRPRT